MLEAEANDDREKFDRPLIGKTKIWEYFNKPF